MTDLPAVAGSTSVALADLAAEYWDTLASVRPLHATLVGDHRFDDRADVVSSADEQQVRGRWVELRAGVEALPADLLGGSERITRGLLLEHLDDAVRDIDERLVELRSDQMQGAHALLLMIAGEFEVPDPQTAEKALARIDAMAAMLDAAAERYREGAAAGRTPARVTVLRSCSQMRGYLDTPEDADPFIALPAPQGWERAEVWRAELAAKVRDVLRPAYRRHLRVFTEVLLPVARGDERPGLVGLAEGEELYAGLVRRHTGTDLSPQELHRTGLERVQQTLPAEFAPVGQRVFGVSGMEQILDRLRTDPAVRYQRAEQIMADALAGVERAGAVASDWFARIPQTPCEIVPVPDYLAPDLPPAYYLTPDVARGRPGSYCVNLYDPPSRSRALTAAITFHEAIPGHHFQVAGAAEMEELPTFRRIAPGHNAFIEGWGLYCERLADEMGLYADDLDRLGMLALDAWRSSRLVVDTGLHALGWSRQQAVDFLLAHSPLDRDVVEVEIDRYIGMPGQALSYTTGQQQILDLRTQAQQRMGAAFDIRDFHSVVLGEGTVTPAIMRQLVQEWIASSEA